MNDSDSQISGTLPSGPPTYAAPPLYDPSRTPFGLPAATTPVSEPDVRPTVPPLVFAGLLALVGVTLAAAMFLLFDTDGGQIVSLGASSSGRATVDENLLLQGEALNVQAVLAVVQESVITIETNEESRRGIFGGAGSGLIISDDGLILTNAHVIAGADTIEVTFFDGTTVEAELVGSFADEDIAVIQAVGVTDTLPATLGSAETMRVGDEVVAIGNALGLGGEPSVTLGIVSAKNREIDADRLRIDDLIQTDAAINPGNSGGPLVNAAGEVIGINTAIIDGAQNIGFAISMDSIIPLIDQLVSGDASITPETAFLGASTKPVAQTTMAERQQFAITVTEGAYVVDVFVGAAAGRAGLQTGDIIVRIDGADVGSPEEVARAIRRKDPGDAIEIEYLRDGDRVAVDIGLGSRADAED